MEISRNSRVIVFGTRHFIAQRRKFPGCKTLEDLERLDNAKKRKPHKLKPAPNVQVEEKMVIVESNTKVFRKQVALVLKVTLVAQFLCLHLEVL